MAKAPDRRTLADIVADLDDPAPRDIDPEAFGRAISYDSEDEPSNGEGGGREHYEEVAESKLRKPAIPDLGRQYSGSKISRDALMSDFEDDTDDDPFAKRNSASSDSGSDGEQTSEAEEHYDDPDEVDVDNHEASDEEIDSDEAFEDGDEDLFKKKGFTFRGSLKPSGRSPGETIAAGLSETLYQNEDFDMNRGEFEEGTNPSGNDEPGSDTEDLGIADGDSNDEENTDSEATRPDSASEDDTEGTTPDEKGTGSIDRAALREMMAADQKSVVETISEATKADIAKGAAVKQQHSAFDALIGTRIQLQKGLVAANSLPAVAKSEDTASEEEKLAAAAEAAENAALALLNSLTTLMHSINEPSSSNNPKTSRNGADAKTNPRKRPFSATLSTPSSEIQASITTLSATMKPRHRSTLTKWANKTQHASALPARSKLLAAPAIQPLTSVLDAHLTGSNLERLVQRTQVPRSCAPLQQASANTKPSKTKPNTPATQPDPSTHQAPVYDDADWYALLLRELIEHKKFYTAKPNSTTNTTATTTKPSTSSFFPSRQAAASSTPNLDAALSVSASLRATKTHRANVDTKASKGRKMRYNVHEKLQNFMAPQEVGTWSRRQAEELFAGLLGRRVAGLGEEESGSEGQVDGDANGEVEGLRLFEGR